MFTLKTIKTKLFWILAITQALFALAIFYNELMSIFNMVPGRNYPIEHRWSWIVVLLFCFGAIASCYLMWLFGIKNKQAALLPSPVMVLVLAALMTISSAVFSHYLSMIGWCCEHPLAFYFGFPFSYLLGIGSFLFSEMLPYKDYGLFKILFTSQPQVHWQFLPYQFFLNFLFWSNIILVLLSSVTQFRQKRSSFEPAKEEIQFETV
jgi:hypothetical protein